jgi:hypothetical protein
MYINILEVVDWGRERRLGMRDRRSESIELMGDLIFISDLLI